ncbi:PP2C family protein-serine/threonine phosphatase [Nonomuraea candida]|uniref:PP2C family protein-serine/threonine phosphatase n=1 Tax=Nonomuraea candida TaxID=359159 RepID=UPI0006949D24|nr:PP2C family protein-serine/threonine phosphatase [Nonomuraea candida]
MVEMVWEDAPYPMLAISTTGVVEQANQAARLLFAEPLVGARLEHSAPGWLSRAHFGCGGSERHGEIGDRVYQAHAVHATADRTVWWLIDVTGRRHEADSLREWAAFLADASSELLPSLNLDRCLEVTACLAARRLAGAALVVLPRPGRRYAIARCARGGQAVREDAVIDPGTLPGLTEALQGFPPVPARWSAPEDVPGWALCDGSGEVGSVAVIALPGHGLPAGALVLLRGSRDGFSDDERMFARLFALWAGSAIAVARLYVEQAVITETLMSELLPPPTPILDGVELAARYRPAGPSERVGGDFYDVYPVSGSGRESLVVLGDVAGKGLEAAVLTGRIRNTLRALLPLADDHHRVLELLNGVLLNDSATTRYVTLVLASFQPRGRRVEMRLTSAGHPAPLIMRTDGRVEAVPAVGTLIGVLDEITSVTDTVVLEPGETCLLYSDGIIEARGGPLGDEFFGEERLSEQLGQCAGMPPEALAERVQMLASQWVGAGEHDDMAVVAISAPRAPRGGHL